MKVKSDFESILKLEDIKITESSFKRIEDDLTNLDLGINVEKEVEKIDENRIKITLKVTVSDDAKNICVEIVCKGTFSINEGADISSFENNAIAILFPYIRSSISIITTQPGIRPIVLPAMNIVAMFDNQKASITSIANQSDNI